MFKRKWIPTQCILLSIKFTILSSFRPHYGPVVVSYSTLNEYQEYFLEVKAAGEYGWQPCHLHVPIVLKYGSLNLLELSGPVKACNGIALPLLATPLILREELMFARLSKNEK
jgi:hypothetical protein